MIKHIVGMAIWMCLALFVFIFLGEHLILEPNEKLRYGREETCYGGAYCVYPGRTKTWSGDPLYKTIYDDEGVTSRHMSWIFHFFVFMQIWNMVCSRKIHDEFNIFEGMCKKIPFMIVWFIIVVGQILISFSGMVFKLHPDGLSWEQHAQAIVYALTVFIVNVLLKLCPDSVFAWINLGPDSVYERSQAAKLAAKTDGVDDMSNAINN